MWDISLWVWAVVAATAGLGLIISGWWPRRRGQTPYCRSCNYNLTGLSAERCPECGRVLSARSVVHGERSRRPGRVLIGVLFLVLAGGAGYRDLRQINWLQYKPVALLLRDVRSPDAAHAGRSLGELQRRYLTGALSPSQKRRLVQLCLDQQVQKSLAVHHRQFTNFLKELYLKRDIDPADERRFLDQMLTPRLRVRPRVPLPDPVPASFDLQYNMPSWVGSLNFWAEVSGGDYALDGEVIGDWKKQTDTVRSFGINARPIRFKTPGVGTHTLTAWVHVTLYYGPRKIHETDLRATAAFEVLSAGSPDGIRFVGDVKLQQAVYPSVQPRDFFITADSAQAGRYKLQGDIWMNNLPANLACEVFIRMDGREHHIDWLLGSEGIRRARRPVSVHLDLGEQEISETIDVILRPSREVSKRSTEIYELLDAELVYPDIPLGRE